MRRAILVAAAALVLAACQTTSGSSAPAGAPPPPAAEFKPTGEVRYFAGSASFDANEVRGPRVHMSRKDDGSWVGTMYDPNNGGESPTEISVYPGRAIGVNLQMYIQRAPNGVVINATYQQRILRYEINTDQLVVRTPSRSLTLPRTSPTTFGASNDVTVVGDAASPNPPWPQIGLALIGAF